MTDKELVKSLEALRNIMVSVSTGGASIQLKNQEYKTIYYEVDADLKVGGFDNPNSYQDLWDWYGRWKNGDLPTYQSRRNFLSDLFNPLIKEIQGDPIRLASEEPTGWERVDRAAVEIRRRLQVAESEEQFQAIGLLCREALISLAEAVFIPVRHISLDGIEPSKTDVKRMLDAYIAVELGGKSHEAARRHARSAFDLALDLQHSRTADFQHAALCVEAATSVINVVSIISGRRKTKVEH